MARTQVNFRLGDEQKQRWREHVEESRYDDTLSDLVKRAVENQIDQDNGEVNEGSTTESPASGEVLDRIQNLRNDIEDLQTDVSQAVDAVHAQEGPDPELQPMVLDNLPESESEALTAAELAHVLGERPSTIRFALENIQRNTNMVKSKRPTQVVETEDEDEAVSTQAVEEDDPVWWRAE